MMKHLLIAFGLLLYSIALFEQDEKDLALFETDSTFLKEIITFPLGFAPEFKYKGYEDLRFAKDWSKKESPEFWSIVYGWNIENTEKQSALALEVNLKLYYNGLMSAVNKDKDYKVPDTQVSLIKNDSKDKDADYTGTITVYDSFWSKTVMTLNVQLKNHYCNENKKSVVVFRISPQAFDHAIWTKLKLVKLREDICKI